MSVAESELLPLLKQPHKRAGAFSALVRLYQSDFTGTSEKMVLSHEDANDILQNTFMKAWNGLDGFRGDSQLSTWLYRIATNETLHISVE
jgi:RNA polymerase sigma-70 factor (ECF subfamily)